MNRAGEPAKIALGLLKLTVPLGVGDRPVQGARRGQRQVLSTYAADHFDTSDLAIEMPTGEGKTLLALLIADWALDQGRSVAYLTGTRQLAERAKEEAKKPGSSTPSASPRRTTAAPSLTTITRPKRSAS